MRRLGNFAFAVTAIFLVSSAFESFLIKAGGQDRAFFNSNGLRIPFDQASSEDTVLPTRLAALCGSERCIPWRIYTSNPSFENLLNQRITEAIQLWTSNSNVNLGFEYQGLQTSLPDHDSAPVDSFGNPQFESEFLISLTPPVAWAAEMAASNEFARSFQYLVPNSNSGEAEIRGASIYLNPKFLPAPYGTCSTGNNCLSITGSNSRSLKSILAFYIGRDFLGLDASGNRDSVMFPIQSVSDNRSFSQLSKDDNNWLERMYSSNWSAELGVLEGRVIEGGSGNSLSGAYVSLIDSDVFDLIANGDFVPLGSYISTGALAQDDGKFQIVAEPGEYILLVEALDRAVLSPNLFNEWMKAFGSSLSFPPEFYDGVGIESNQEAWDGSLPSLILSAKVQIRAGEANSGIEIITQNTSSSLLVASGNPDESLSPFGLEDLEELLRSSLSEDEKLLRSASSGGCQLHVSYSQKKDDRSKYFVLFILLVSLGLLSRRFSTRYLNFQKE